MGELAGTWPLVRLALRRDRVRLPLWAGTAAVYLPLLQAPAFDALYPTQAEVAKAAADFDGNTTFRMLYGPVPSPSIGGLVIWRGSFLLVVVGLAAALTVIRHTRADEQDGRAELVLATSVGRRAPLAAALIMAIGAALAIGVVSGAGLALEGYGTSGGIAHGLAVLGAGAVFAMVGAVAAQLAEGASAARGIAVALLSGAYLLRASADVQADGSLHWLTWLSPIGWLHEVDPYGADRFAVFALPVLATLVLLGATSALARHRDLGAGVLPPRPGPPVAAPSLRSPLALAWRLQRGSVVAWAAGLALIGAVLGGAASGAQQLLEDNQDLQDIFERLGGAQVLTDAFLAGVFGIVGLMAAGQAIQVAVRLRAEEEAGRAEAILATPVGRSRWALAHLSLAAIAPALSLLAAGLGGVVTFGLSEHDLGAAVGPVLRAAMVQLPAVWSVAAVAVALLGILPRWTSAAWAVLSACFLLGQVGAILDLDQHVMDLSPFTHVPALPGHALLVPLVALCGVAAAVTTAGLAALARRDLG